MALAIRPRFPFSRLWVLLWFALSNVLCPLQVHGDEHVSPSKRHELPNWSTLSFEQRSFFTTARSNLALDLCAPGQTEWCMTINSSVADSREEIILRTTDGGALLERKRFSKGRDQRRKRWLYSASELTRERLELNGNGTWEQTSERSLSLPTDSAQVTDSHLLLALANVPRQVTFDVNTDLNFYRVTATPAGEDLVEVSEELAKNTLLAAHGQNKQAGYREVNLVRLSAVALAPLSDKPDFSLLGLSGVILIAFDRQSGLPLELRGRAPRIGQVRLKLQSASPRPDIPAQAQ